MAGQVIRGSVLSSAPCAKLALTSSFTESRHNLRSAPVEGVRWQNASSAISNSAAEPKWKQKLAAADAHAEATRQLTAQAQGEYEERRRQAAVRGSGAGAITPLKDLEWIPFLTEEGRFTDCSQADAKASVYAIFDEEKELQYIGISRQVFQSMRLHFARVPRQCVWLKVQHITKPSRTILEATRDAWIKENGSRPRGNDGAEEQNRWENPLDCKPLMTADEQAALAAASPAEIPKILKNAARRIEKDIEAGFRERKCTETMRFDPKLKEQGLLDLKNVQPSPAAAPPPQTTLATATQEAAVA
eukprot:TRINITY_DN16924_c0_g1_i1.p1 TRINITY_DN16924_c0_g1~~TRINITY_DN16924_c0_g1_i1.p1  ORF type:complete len:303 (-),score=67.36 TRINITY_DN16924_c0_g1_i1:562-1470(-)